MADNENTRAPAGGSEPGWKKHGRNGPLDWWLACQTHGYDYTTACMSCGIASDHNTEFARKFSLENREPQAGQDVDVSDTRGKA